MSQCVFAQTSFLLLLQLTLSFVIVTSDLLQPQVGLSQGSTSYVSPDARDLRIGLWIAGVAEAAEAGTLENPRVTDIPKEKERKTGIKNILVIVILLLQIFLILIFYAEAHI